MSTNTKLAERLRAACATVRTKSMPLADLIPLMQQAADKLAAHDAEQAVQAVPAGWRIQRNADGSIGLFAPPPKDGESRRTSECFTGRLGNDKEEIVFKLLDHVLAAAPAAPAPEARCDCGKKPASECDKWEPGCDLGHSPEHARVVRVDVKAQAAGKETKW